MISAISIPVPVSSTHSLLCTDSLLNSQFVLPHIHAFIRPPLFRNLFHAPYTPKFIAVFDDGMMVDDGEILFWIVDKETVSATPSARRS